VPLAAELRVLVDFGEALVYSINAFAAGVVSGAILSQGLSFLALSTR
jgi:hypothetical protein